MGAINEKLQKYGTLAPGPGAYKPINVNDT
jgi:hypothetical protein